MAEQKIKMTPARIRLIEDRHREAMNLAEDNNPSTMLGEKDSYTRRGKLITAANNLHQAAYGDNMEFSGTGRVLRSYDAYEFIMGFRMPEIDK